MEQNNDAAALGLGASGIAGLSQLAGAYGQYQANINRGKYQRSIGNLNAQMAQLQAQDALRRGSAASSLIGRRGAAIQGEQRVGLAASGVDVNSGTAAEIQDNTATLTRMDQLTAQNNAALEALGYKMEATNMTAQGRMAYLAGRNEGTQSLISGGMGFARNAMQGAYEYDRYHIRAPGAPPAPLAGVDQGSGVPSDVG